MKDESGTRRARPTPFSFQFILHPSSLILTIEEPGRAVRLTSAQNVNEGVQMRTFAVAAGLVLALGLTARAEDIKLEGKYTVVTGKKEGKPIDEKAKKATYTATADTFTIEGGKEKFVIGFKIKPGTDPVEIDMAIASGPDGTKGTVALGIIEVKGDTVKLAYSLDKEKRPKDFEGKSGYYIELKRAK
jgi:uncharacterized protein (TIGR03067 family)